MKKHLLPLFAVLSLCSGSLFAQNANSSDSSIGLPTQKGSFMVGSDLLLGELKFGEGSPAVYNIGLSPRAGYFVANNLMVGAKVSGQFTGGIYNSELDYKYNSQGVGVGIFARKYFGRMIDQKGEMKKLRFFVEGGIDYARGWATYSAPNEPVQRFTYEDAHWNVMSGFSYFITRNIALEAGLNYSNAFQKFNVVQNTSNLSLNIGFKIFLGGKK